jgi:hypothetical protein
VAFVKPKIRLKGGLKIRANPDFEKIRVGS